MRGTILTAVSFALWGVLPGYWKMLAAVPALQIVGHRTIWTCLFAFLLIIITGKLYAVREALSKRGTRMLIMAGSLMIAINWLIYIYAVNSGNIVQASLGYYINPLVSILLGMAVLRERLSTPQISAFLLAACGVLYMTFSLGSFPWISVALAVSFALYGLVKKSTGVDSVSSLAIESIFLAPVALPAATGFLSGAFVPFGSTMLTGVLLVSGGVVTGLPLYLFAEGAKAIPLSRVGFLQYISPTLSLLIAVFIYGESFTLVHAVSFGFIWTGLFVYTASGYMNYRNSR
ncbi:MAG TPA: EamA family transporter RarD [Spirochaetota bacterium]|nr:EamA family transporter RarD [Spirochaetota bacterium]